MTIERLGTIRNRSSPTPRRVPPVAAARAPARAEASCVTMSYVVTRDPATGEELRRYAALGEAGVDAALADAAAAAAVWAATPLAERLACSARSASC